MAAISINGRIHGDFYCRSRKSGERRRGGDGGHRRSGDGFAEICFTKVEGRGSDRNEVRDGDHPGQSAGAWLSGSGGVGDGNGRLSRRRLFRHWSRGELKEAAQCN
nr:hypothetical protein Iba_scaffold1677835CG0010 [Ipomoea batatas]